MGDTKATAQAPEDRPCAVCGNPECDDPAHSGSSPETPARRNAGPGETPALRSAAERAADMGFVGGTSELAQALSGGDGAMMAAAAREKYTIESHMTLAQKFPRKEYLAAKAILKTCERPEFAMAARYSFPRAGKPVEGPSAPFARELARLWGHNESGLRIIGIDETHVHIAGFARDYQTGAVFVVEDKFRRKIQRKRGGQTVWIEPDERDLRELVFRRGAICQRNAILMLIPFDLVEEAQKVVRETNEAAAKLDLNKDREGTIANMLAAFEALPTPVSREMIEKRIGKDIDTIEPADYIMIKKIYRSLLDGVVSRDEIFGAQTQAKVDPEASMEPREVPTEEMTVEEQAAAKKVAAPEPRPGPNTADSSGQPKPSTTGEPPAEQAETTAKSEEPQDPPPARPIPKDSTGQAPRKDALFPEDPRS